MFDVILNQTKILEQFGGIWIIALLIFSRSIAFSSVAPLIGHKSVPALVRISFGILLTLIILPNINTPAEYPRDFQFIYLIVMNVLVGLFIGWIATLMIEIIKVAGEMVDMQMALNAATIFDPGTQTQATIMGRFFNFIGLVLFISIGGMEKIIEGLFKSYNTFPVILYEININLDKILKATSEVLTIGFLVVSPILVILLVQDLILGLMSRAAPQINAFQISFSIKPSTGMIILLILLPAIFQIFSNLFSNPMRFLKTTHEA